VTLAVITTSDQLTEYPVDGGPVVMVGKDGQLYTVLFDGDCRARLDLQGQATGAWSLPGAGGSRPTRNLSQDLSPMLEPSSHGSDRHEPCDRSLE
jgi:hypothetical protein